jgi:hypothetical protein
MEAKVPGVVMDAAPTASSSRWAGTGTASAGMAVLDPILDAVPGLRFPACRQDGHAAAGP